MYINEKGKITNRGFYDNNWKTNIALIISYIFDFAFFTYSVIKLEEKIQCICIITAIYLLLILIITSQTLFVKYKIVEEGLWIKYPLEFPKILPWTDFQQICVCYSNTSGPGTYVFICFIKHGEQKSFMSGRWKAGSFLHYRSVITMDYTFELYKSIKKMCPYDIVDLRETTNYKIFTRKS